MRGVLSGGGTQTIEKQGSFSGNGMKQTSIVFTDSASFREQLSQLKTGVAHRAHRSPFFQILSVRDDKAAITEIARLLAEVFPDAAWLACCTAGNIANSQIAAEITVIATVFESPETFFKLAQYEIAADTMSDVTTMLLSEISGTGVKAVELYVSLQEFSVQHFCRLMDAAPRDVRITGGFSGSPDPTSKASFVASSAGPYTKTGMVALFYGGADLHVETYKVSGWTPLGRSFRVTKAVGRMLYEIDNAPAFDIYHKYLNIENDEGFFLNALEFPLIYENEGASIMRVPGASTPDRALLLASPIEIGTRVRLSYGDPQSIMDCVHDVAERVNDFCPDVLHIVTCLARKTFWSFRDPAYELTPFKDTASFSSGYFSHGEFIRENGHLNQHTMTLVIAAMREGKAPNRPIRPLPPRTPLPSHIPLISRMGTFIRETTYELEEMNSRLQAMNRQLQEVAVTDALTGLGNRMAFDRKIEAIAAEGICPRDWVMLMLDVNGLKYTNDIFGHAAGDSLILAAANVIKETYGKQGECYRLGGDEFVVLILASLQELDKLHAKFDAAQKAFNKTSVYRLSIARGESHLNNACGLQRSISDWKMNADLAMYRNKVSSHKKRDDSKLSDLRGLIDCVISLEEAKDPYTAHHSKRVRKLSELLARKLGLSEQTVCIVADAAHLHDIGKIGISDGVLTKPARLSMGEINLIRQHPVIGARILMKANRTQEVVRIVMHHHERWNGTGYPDGLAKQDIPIGARIVAIADSIDAMCSRRCYRNSLSFKHCREEIERNLGIMYDPAIGKIALDNWDEIEELLLTSLKHLDGDCETKA